MNWGNKQIGKLSKIANEAKSAKAKKHNDRIKEIIDFVISKGGRLKDAVEYLNDLGLKTRSGQPYTYKNLYRISKSK